MASTVYASSLEPVTDIASNPPPNPDCSVGAPELPLVLYIARVPGSRDVFLTPMKPRDRVVSAQDVQSALYFIHLNSEKDFAEPRQELLEDDESVSLAPSLPPRTIPSESFPHSGLDQVSDAPPCQLSPLRQNVVARKAVPSRVTNIDDSKHQLPALPRLPPRPLPPPPKEDESSSTSLYKENVRLLRNTDHTKMRNPYDQTYPAGQDTWIDPTFRPAAETLTLIRRNPSTHEQWNVASIHDPPIHEVSSAALLNNGTTNRSKRSGAPIYLEITNPAYAQFLDNVPAASHTDTPPEPSNQGHAPPATFHRRLYIPGSRHGVHAHKYTHSSNGGSEGSNEEPHHPRNSMDTSAPLAISDRRAKGYTFDTPWASRCEFHTGATGNNLKCRHLTPSGRSLEVSELRFNLPSATSSSARGGGGGGGAPGPAPGSEKRASYMHRLHQRMRSADSPSSAGIIAEPKPLGQRTPTLVLEEDERVDLSLGRERAGGGFAGRQAKLGKLIIEPEGLKMLDLLVAANVGLWWRAYER